MTIFIENYFIRDSFRSVIYFKQFYMLKMFFFFLVMNVININDQIYSLIIIV